MLVQESREELLLGEVFDVFTELDDGPLESAAEGPRNAAEDGALLLVAIPARLRSPRRLRGVGRACGLGDAVLWS